MPKIETCPHCSKKIDISPILKQKMPFRDLFNPTQWFKGGKKIKEYDLINCPFCHSDFRAASAKFFGFITPKHLFQLLVLFYGLIIIDAILLFLKNMGIIK